MEFPMYLVVFMTNVYYDFTGYCCRLNPVSLNFIC